MGCSGPCWAPCRGGHHRKRPTLRVHVCMCIHCVCTCVCMRVGCVHRCACCVHVGVHLLHVCVHVCAGGA